MEEEAREDDQMGQGRRQDQVEAGIAKDLAAGVLAPGRPAPRRLRRRIGEQAPVAGAMAPEHPQHRRHDEERHRRAQHPPGPAPADGGDQGHGDQRQRRLADGLAERGDARGLAALAAEIARHAGGRGMNRQPRPGEAEREQGEGEERHAGRRRHEETRRHQPGADHRRVMAQIDIVDLAAEPYDGEPTAKRRQRIDRSERPVGQGELGADLGAEQPDEVGVADARGHGEQQAVGEEPAVLEHECQVVPHRNLSSKMAGPGRASLRRGQARIRRGTPTGERSSQLIPKVLDNDP